MSKQGSSRKALILGATGLIGSHCLRAVLDSGLYGEVIVLGRRKAPLVHSRLKQVVVEFDQLSQPLAGMQVDDIFCCLGTTMKKAGSESAFRKVDLEYPLLVAKEARAQGASHFLVVSAIGADPQSLFFYNRVKGELERALERLNFPYLSIFRPSLLLGDRDEARPLESLSGHLLGWASPFMKGPFNRIKPIAAEKVAHAMVVEAKKAASYARPPGVLIIDSAIMQDYEVNA